MPKRQALTIAAALVVSISLSSTFAQTGKRNSQRPRKPAASRKSNPIDSEAAMEVNKAWEKYLTQCGETYLLKAKGNAFSMGTIWEYRSVTIGYQKSQLDEADRLNGIEWKGTSTLKAQTGRTYNFRSGWSKWDSTAVIFTFYLTRTQGNWTATEPGFFGLLRLELTKPTCSEIPGFQNAPAENSDDIPQWITQLRSHPIIRGVGLAGIRLGQSESEVIDVLGEPTKRFPVKTVDGRIIDYALVYQYGSMFVGIYTSADQRLVYSIRLSDDNFNRDHYIPNTANGATVGDTVIQLLRFGKPIQTQEHFTCPDSLKSNHAFTYYYQGISFWGCEANGLVYLIDIP